MAVIVVDMIKDNVMSEEFGAIVPNIKKFLGECRKRGIPIIFANDSFLPQDPLFNYMPLHAIRGTPGVEVIDDLKPERGDLVLEKRRFSAFFKTDLDMTLRSLNVDTVAICGIATHVCVLFTAGDAVSYDFSVILVEDCCASHKREIHEMILSIYGKLPIIQILKSEDVIKTLEEGRSNR